MSLYAGGYYLELVVDSGLTAGKKFFVELPDSFFVVPIVRAFHRLGNRVVQRQRFENCLEKLRKKSE